ncbi:hypothetical protein [Brevibacillus brevis]|uniref:Core-binding (CB) domain-containing protein n=1 Tax=Brevibacillus brevis TaxID=1393 RepID=A0ABY9T462_BREBE|nr:hypothetical protein [Brevibacillus brevis]WNC14873.1 hypothetical protein RGB73_00280 [Brevibacillus brevis]
METGTESRKGKRIVLQRGKASSGDISTLRESQTTIQEAFELFVCIKEAENVKTRTKSEYYVQYRYFVDWLQEQHSEVVYVQDVSTSMIRSYINYLAYEKEKYEGIPYRSEMLGNQKGLCLTPSISVYGFLNAGSTYWSEKS